MKSQKLREKIKKITPAFFHVGLFAVAVSAAYLAMETSYGEIRNQMTTLDDWSEEANERFANYK